MAVLLMKLRYVPEDELEEITALLEQHGLEFYATSAGTFGISLPALWLVDSERLQEARSLLDVFAAERQSRARAMFDALKEAGKPRTALDMAKENPLRYLLSLVLLAALLYVALVPFW